MHGITRRSALAGIASALMLPAALREPALAAALEQSGLALGPAREFSLDVLKARAAALARKPLQRAEVPAAATIHAIDYDAFQKISFRRDHSLWRNGDSGAPVQFFHLGRYSPEGCHISVVDGGKAREVLYRQDYFNMPADHVARRLPSDIGFAGFRVMGETQDTDWLAFLGASYFRSSGGANQYGLSARGLAIDTVGAGGEEFPRFTDFWLEAHPDQRDRLIVYALLDSPSVAGAYRFDCTKADGVVMEADVELFPRKPIEAMGVAPLTSMFWYSEKDRPQAVDWRPEIHDSDGLAIWAGTGERIWRPLNNPPRVMTNSFFDNNPKGFGLLQRDRKFENYQDDGVFYNRRPSLWVEPLEGWGSGAIQLVEIPTDDEIHDNIVACWIPTEPVEPGQSYAYRYRLFWSNDEPYPAPAGKVVQTLIGIGGIPGQERPEGLHKFVVDFTGGAVGQYSREDGVTPVITTSRGEIGLSNAYPVVGEPGRFRAMFDLKLSGADPVDMRLYLARGDLALTETCVCQYFPDDRQAGSGDDVSTQ